MYADEFGFVYLFLINFSVGVNDNNNGALCVNLEEKFMRKKIESSCRERLF